MDTDQGWLCVQNAVYWRTIAISSPHVPPMTHFPHSQGKVWKLTQLQQTNRHHTDLFPLEHINSTSTVASAKFVPHANRIGLVPSSQNTVCRAAGNQSNWWWFHKRICGWRQITKTSTFRGSSTPLTTIESLKMAAYFFSKPPRHYSSWFWQLWNCWVQMTKNLLAWQFYWLTSSKAKVLNCGLLCWTTYEILSKQNQRQRLNRTKANETTIYCDM